MNDANLPSHVEMALLWVREEAEPTRRAESDAQDSHAVMFHTVCVLVQGFDLGDADLFSVLHDYAGRSDQPWTEPELQHKVDGARMTASRYPKGWMYRKMCWDRGYRRRHSVPLKPAMAGQSEMNMELHRPKAEVKWKLEFSLEALRCVQVPGLSVDFLWLSPRSLPLHENRRLPKPVEHSVPYGVGTVNWPLADHERLAHPKPVAGFAVRAIRRVVFKRSLVVEAPMRLFLLHSPAILAECGAIRPLGRLWLHDAAGLCLSSVEDGADHGAAE